MPERLVVHVGPPKTASTFIQRGLYANAAELARQGIYLPVAARLELEPRACCHHHLAWELMGSARFRAERGGWGALAAEIESVGDTAATVVLSSEVLGRAVQEFKLGDEIDERLRMLGRDITVVYVVRDQLSAINSTYAQQVKMMEPMPDFAVHARWAVGSGSFDLDAQLARWRDAADIELVAIPYAIPGGPDPFRAFIRAARLDLDESALVVEPEPVNITLGPIAVEAIRLLRAYLLALNPLLCDDDDAVRRLHRMAARAAQANGWTREAFWGWDRDEAEFAAAAFADSNERFARTVWGTPWPMPLPVERASTRVDPLELRPRDLDQVHQFVATMARRYVKLLAGPEVDPADA